MRSESLQQAVDEARMIVARHDGIHHLHGDAAALVLLLKCAQRGLPVNSADIDRILRRMRRAAKTGCWAE